MGELVCLSVPVSETSVVRRLTQTFSLFSAWKCKLNVRLPLVCAEEEGGREGERVIHARGLRAPQRKARPCLEKERL